MKYYKITNKEENHNGLQYHTGLNVDPKPFKPHGNCDDGGIYFASTDILAFLHCGPWIREVTFPDGELVYKNPGEPKNYKAHRVILGERREIAPDVIKELVEEGADPRAGNECALRWACRYGHLEIAKYLVSLGCDPRIYDDYALQGACENGHLEIVKYLVSVGCDHSVFHYSIFRLARKNNHTEVVKYLESLL